MWSIHAVYAVRKSIAGAVHGTHLPPHDMASQSDITMSSISPKSGSVSIVIRSNKSAVSKHAHKCDTNFSWQPGYYDTIICTTGQLSRIRKYILDNTQRWVENI